MYVVVVALAEKRIGLIVDRLVGQEEIVIKSLGEYIGGNIGIAGATIMGDGKVRLIIDVSGVMEIATKMPRRIKHKKSSNKYKRSKEDNIVRVLVVDDSATDRKIMKRLLTSTGWIEVIEVSNPHDALTAAQSIDIDLIITDIVMPEMDGFELAKTIKEKGVDKPIIAVSARGEASNIQKAKLYGISAYLVKPINLDEMVSKIDKLVEKAHT
jgi:two-component system chemotaxis sensor kinase CheA